MLDRCEEFCNNLEHNNQSKNINWQTLHNFKSGSTKRTPLNGIASNSDELPPLDQTLRQSLNNLASHFAKQCDIPSDMQYDRNNVNLFATCFKIAC